MVADTTTERLILKYMRTIKHAESKDELSAIDNDITWNDDVSTVGYAILMTAIQIREEALK